MGVNLGINFLDLVADWEKVHASGVATEGKYVKELELEIFNWSGLFATAVNSAGSGLYLMALSLLHKKGKSRVAVPSNTFYATGAMFKHAGHDLVLVDCNRYDFSMSYDHLTMLDPPPDAVVLTHVGGQLARDYEVISVWCEDLDIPLFEDAAHVLGVKENKVTAGDWSQGAVYSLYPTKSIPAGEGGILVTKDAELAEMWSKRRSYAKYMKDGVMRYGNENPYGEPYVGFNFRMDEWTAVVALKQWQRREEILADRAVQAAKLAEIFGPNMLEQEGGVSNYYKYPVPLAKAVNIGIKKFSGAIYSRTDQLQAALGLPETYLPNSRWVADNHVCIPLHEGLYNNMNSEQILAYLREE